MDDSDFRSAPWEESEFGDGLAILEERRGRAGRGGRLPRSDVPLVLHGVVSLVEFPVFVGDEWWGTSASTIVSMLRDWNGDELAALRASATLLGAPSTTARDDRIAQAEDRYRRSSERVPAVMYVDVLDGDALRVESIGTQVEELLGYPHERFVDDPVLAFGPASRRSSARRRQHRAVRPRVRLEWSTG